MAEVRQRSFGDYAEAFASDGVIHIPHVLSSDQLGLVEGAIAWVLDNLPCQEMFPGSGATFLTAMGDSSDEKSFRRMLRETPLADVAAALFGSGPVWFTDEQLFYKEGTATGARRSPWHQDASFYPYRGHKQVVVWVSLDPMPKECALEVVRGSHLGPLFSTAKFGGEDDTAPLYAESAFPRLPDIEAEREKWDIVSWASEPGDLLIFHPAALHGGAATHPHSRRRSLAVRFAGDDVVRVEQTDPAPQYDSFLNRYWALPPGAPISCAGSMRVRPWET